MDDNFVDDLILDGSLQVAGVDEENGDLLFSFTDELQDKHPELFRIFNEHFHKEIMSLWEKGYISMDPSEENPLVNITQKGMDAVKTAELDPELQLRLKDILGRLK